MSFADYFTQTLKEKETVVAILRKHWITLAFPIVLGAVVIALLIVFMDYFFKNQITTWLWIILLGLIVLYLGYRWIIYFFDSFIITDMRIIDIDQHGLFKRTVTETTFEKVQDVTYSVMGFIATALNYGTVTVQTAAQETKLELNRVARPKQVQEILTEAQKLFEKRHADPDLTAQELIELIARVKEKEQRESQAGDAEE